MRVYSGWQLQFECSTSECRWFNTSATDQPARDDNLSDIVNRFPAKQNESMKLLQHWQAGPFMILNSPTAKDKEAHRS
jgi:hypothetical protein